MITARRKFTTKITLTGFQVSILPLESIQSHSPASTLRMVQETSTNFQRRPTRVDSMTDNADITQSQAVNHHGLLNHVTLGLVECRK